MAILLLQGPLGPFFNHLAVALNKQGQAVYKINFNGGDNAFYSQPNNINFTGTVDQWPEFLARVIKKNNIRLVFAYGDCRLYHHKAKSVCDDAAIKYYAFEEGYLRPNYITFEAGGVNGHSPITHGAVEQYKPVHSVQDEYIIPGNFLKRVVYAVSYYAMGFIQSLKFSNYKHHRSFNIYYEPFCWVRGFLRKGLYKLIEPDASVMCEKGEFFLVPLQVHNDAQIEFHSQYDSMGGFIKNVLISFSESNQTCNLIFKHHPMDRGHVHYGALIKKIAASLNLTGQVYYIHDQHLPTLLKKCKGVVTINSTTALQAFYHSAPVVVMGEAFFDMPGLTHQGNLASFWCDPTSIDDEFADQFRAYLLDHGQVNGSFYCVTEQTMKSLIVYLRLHGILR